MQVPLPPEPADIPGRLEWALARLVDARTAHTLINVTMAIRSLVATVHRPNRCEAPPMLVERIREALDVVAQQVADDASPLREDDVLDGITAAAGLLSLFHRSDSELVDAVTMNRLADYVDRAMLLSDELSAVVRRRSIAARRAGEPGFQGGALPADPVISLH